MTGSDGGQQEERRVYTILPHAMEPKSGTAVSDGTAVMLPAQDERSALPAESAPMQAPGKNDKKKKRQNSVIITLDPSKLRAREEKKKKTEEKEKEKEERKKKERDGKVDAETWVEHGEGKHQDDPEAFPEDQNEEPEGEPFVQKPCRRVCVTIVVLISLTFIALSIYVGINATYQSSSSEATNPDADGLGNTLVLGAGITGTSVDTAAMNHVATERMEDDVAFESAELPPSTSGN